MTGASLATTMMSASLLQASIGALSPLVLADLRISRTGLGVLLSGYYIAAALTSTPLGRLIDRLGVRRGLELVLALAILATGTAALSRGQVLFGVSLLVSGLAVAAANPATNLALAATSPPHGMLVGVKQSGVQLAPVVAGLCLAPAAAAFGWRAAIGVASALAAVVLVAVHVSWSAAPRRVSRRPPATHDAGAAGPSLRWLSAYAFCMGVGYASVAIYLALFAHETLSFSEPRAAVLIAVIGVAAVAARIGWSVLVERGRGWLGSERSVLVLIALTAIVAAIGLLASEHVTAGLVWPAAFGIGISAAAWNGVVMLVLVRGANPGVGLGRASGRVLGMFFLGLALGPPVFGAAVDRTGGYTIGWIWALAAFAASLGAALALSRTPRPRPTEAVGAEMMRGAP